VIERYLANAGSGKTYALSGAWLRVAHAGVVSGDPDRMNSILATTFTRAAARDILAKILVRLAEGVLEDNKRTELARSILGTEAGHEVQAERLLEAVVARLDRIEVRTLDSLLMRMARAYALELDIGVQHSALDESAASEVLRDALVAVARADCKGAAGMLRLLQLNEDRVNAFEEVHEMARSLLIAWQDSGGGSEQGDGVPACWLGPGEVTRIARGASMDDALRRAQSGLLELGERHKKILEDATSGSFAKFVEDARRGTPSARACGNYLSSGALKAVVEGKSKYYGKELSPDLQRDLQLLVDWLRGEILHAKLCGHQEAARLATMLVAAERDALRLRGACTFESITRSVAGGMSDAGMAEILMRLDQQVHHLLLDEFQDTSLSQWQALEPLAISLAAGGDEPRSILVVGDIKQSIYGWRSGDPRLLRGLETLLSEGAPAEVRDCTLTTSYRSAPIVLEAVDTVFNALQLPTHPLRFLSSTEDSGNRANLVEALDAWLDGYEPHQAAERNRGLAGSVGLTKCGSREERLDWCARKAVQFWQRSRGSRSIAVIHETNKDASEVAERIRAIDGSPGCSLRARGSLRDSAVVLAFLDAIRAAAHPKDHTAFLSVLMSPLRDVWNVGVDTVHPWNVRASQSPDASKQLLRKFSRGTIAATLNEWRVELSRRGLLGANDRRRLDRALHVIARAERTGSTLDEIVDAVEREDCRDVEGQPIESITVHQAKGLEWDIVIFGARDNAPQRRTKQIAVERNIPYRGIGTDRVAPSVKRAHCDGVVGEVNDSAERFDFQDKLSVLYVALTRAKRGLHLVVDQKTGKKDGKNDGKPDHAPKANHSAGSIILEAFRDGSFLQRAGDESWMEGAPEPSRPTVLVTAPRLPAAPRTPLRGLPAAPASRQSPTTHAIELPDVAAPSPAQRAALDRGTLAHAVCEHLEWSDGWQPDVDVIARAIAPTVTYPDAASITRGVRETIDQLRAPEIAKALARPPENAIALRERKFLALVEGDRVRQGSIDRLVLRGAPGAWRHLQVVDFKTDQPPSGATSEQVDAWIAGRVAHHRQQLDEYRIAMAREYRVPTEQSELLLVLLACGRAVSA